MDIHHARLLKKKKFWKPRGGSNPQPSDDQRDSHGERRRWVTVAQWLERVTGHQMVEASIPVGIPKSFSRENESTNFYFSFETIYDCCKKAVYDLYPKEGWF